MPNPANPYAQITGLKKASSIGASPAEADPQSRENWSPGKMPIAIPGETTSFNPFKAAFGESETVLDGLRRLMGAGKGAGVAQTAKVVPGAVQGLAEAIPVAETLGEQNPYFTPQGGEDMYNVARKAVAPVLDPQEVAYNRLKGTMGR